LRRPILVMLSVLLAAAPAFTQTRNRSTAKPKTTATAPAQKTSQARTAGATRVADQIKFLTRFIYLLGGVASGIAAVDEAAKRNEATPAILQKNQQSKTTVRTSIQGFRESLDKLEIDFRAHAESMGAVAVKVASIAELEQAIEASKKNDRTSVIVIDTDPLITTDEGGHWWDVAVPEVSPRLEVNKARAAYEKARAVQRIG